MTLTSVELATALAFWQERLRLQQWRIRLKIVKLDDLRGRVGECDPLYSQLIATIKLADTDSLRDGAYPEHQDVELTLVHELIHLHFWSLEIDEKKHPTRHSLLEQAIDCLATALVDTRRFPLSNTLTENRSPEPEKREDMTDDTSLAAQLERLEIECARIGRELRDALLEGQRLTARIIALENTLGPSAHTRAVEALQGGADDHDARDGT